MRLPSATPDRRAAWTPPRPGRRRRRATVAAPSETSTLETLQDEVEAPGTRRTTTRPTGGSPRPGEPARPAPARAEEEPERLGQRRVSRPPPRNRAWSQSASHRVRARTAMLSDDREPRHRREQDAAVREGGRSERAQEEKAGHVGQALGHHHRRDPGQALADQVTHQDGLEQLSPTLPGVIDMVKPARKTSAALTEGQGDCRGGAGRSATSRIGARSSPEQPPGWRASAH